MAALTPLSVALDWTPNANHVGFYVARARGLYAARGLDVTFRLPDEDAYAQSPAKAVLSGAAHLAVAPQAHSEVRLFERVRGGRRRRRRRLSGRWGGGAVGRRGLWVGV